MAYSQKPLIELLKAGAVPSESEIPKHVETVISNVFLFPTKVYKFYKNDNEFFNAKFRDISSREERFSFTEADFAWNHLLSPSIHLGVSGARVGYNQVMLAEPAADDEERVIVMRRVDAKDFLYTRLLEGRVSEADAYQMGLQLVENLKTVRAQKLTGHDYYALAQERIEDVQDWIKNVSDLIPKEEQDTYVSYLFEFHEKHMKLFIALSDELASAGDLHSHNAVFGGGKLYLVDTYPPKADWMIEYRMEPAYRLGTDLYALGSEELYKKFIAGYEKHMDVPVHKELEPYYIVYSSLIMVSYLYMLQRTAPVHRKAAERFHKFIQDYYATIRR